MSLSNTQQQLLAGECHNPFKTLGPQYHEERVSWRVLLPFASEASLQGTKQRSFKMQRIDDSAIFEWTGKAKKLPKHPHIYWCDELGNEYTNQDPYSFEPTLATPDLENYSNGVSFDSYRFMGAHTSDIDEVQGVQFTIWAPNARRVSVIGEFNRWHGLTHPMQSCGESGVWTLFIPGILAGALYKFEILGAKGVTVKADPYAHQAEHRPRTASIVSGTSNHEWKDGTWLANRTQFDWQHAPITIYEVHMGSWHNPQTDPASFRELAVSLVNYVKLQGYSHIQLLPIAEHPLDDSWGYQTTGYYAPTSRYGSPDDLRHFVDSCHQQDIGVILDWTPAHFPKDSHGLAMFDGTFLYEHADPKQREHPDWNTLIFNYSRNEVRSFLLSNAAYWLDEYHFDGLRVDAVASMLYLDYSRSAGDWTPNQYGGNENLAAMSFLRELNILAHKRWPGAMVIAEESTAWPMVSRPVHLGGLGFSMKWNMGWMNDSLAYMQEDPIHRQYHHDALTFPIMYAFTENFVLPLSHDEVVHQKGSLLAKMPGDEWQRFANLRLLYAYQYTMPGKKLQFMGNELGMYEEWCFRDSLPWHLTDYPLHQGTQTLVRDLNHLLRDSKPLHLRDFEETGFRWLDCHDNSQSVLSFVRYSEDQFVICLLNFTPVPRHGYRIGAPQQGRYREIFNSDSKHYGGSNLGNGGVLDSDAIAWMGMPASISLTLPPLGALILSLQS